MAIFNSYVKLPEGMFCINNRNMRVSNFDSYAFVVLFWQKKTMRLSGYFMGYYMGNIKNNVILVLYMSKPYQCYMGNHWDVIWDMSWDMWYIYILKGYSMILMKSPTKRDCMGNK